MQPSPITAISNALTLPGRSVPLMRERIFALEEKIKAMPAALGAKDFETNHHFGPGTYMRELVIPADMILTGRIHKYAHLNILTKGKITVWTEDGMKTLEAPCVIKSEAGMKRVGYTHEDSIWTTIHSNTGNEKDIEKVESALFTDTFDDLYLTSGRTIADVCVAIGVTADEMRAISENEADQIQCPIGQYGISVRASEIQGFGIFSDNSFNGGDGIGLARIDGKRTPLGRYCNHSATPNAEMRMREGGIVHVVATQDIAPNTEILVDYYLAYKNTRPVAAIELESI
jgi:SET domain-containing protein